MAEPTTDVAEVETVGDPAVVKEVREAVVPILGVCVSVPPPSVKTLVASMIAVGAVPSVL